MKRTFDVLCAALGLMVLCPMLLAIALVIASGDGGSPFYRGWRVGLRGKPFRIFKFRTMHPHAERSGVTSTADDDPRLTRIGFVLRRYKLDELPQLWNVLRGEMSLVGPRPQVQWAVDRYTTEERSLLDIKPGITDYASLLFVDEGAVLRGSSDPDGDYLAKIHPAKVGLSLRYISKVGFWEDVRILCATVGALFGFDPSWCLPDDTRAWLREKVPSLSN